MNLRDYQQDTVEAIRAAYRNGKRAPIVVLSTGAGKTVTFSYVAKNAAKKNGIVFIIAHREELIKQIAMTLARNEQEHAIVSNDSVTRQCKIDQFKAFGRSFVDQTSRVFVCSVQTLINRMEKLPDPTLIIIDESHHCVEGNQWGKVLSRYKNARVLMVTATPIRSDGKGLGVGHGGYADEMIEGVSMKWLIEQGYLSPYRYFAPPTDIDLTGVNITAGGDYNTKKLDDAMDKPVITGSAVEHYLKLANGKRAIVFCVSVKHAEHVSNEFNSAGIKSEFIEGKTENRNEMIERFSRGETLVLTSCDLVSEGFDLPAIEVAILMRPTKSTGLFMQQVGRALRVIEGKKEAIILDHVGAWKEHGFPDDEREWTLEGVKKRKRKTDDDEAPKIKCCPSCFAVHEPAPECPKCGHEYPVVQARQVEEVEGELQELKPEDIERREARKAQGRAQSIEQLIAIGKTRKQAEIIIKSREEKAELKAEIMKHVQRLYKTRKMTAKDSTGHTTDEIQRMKPKQLKETLAKVSIIE